MEEKEINLIIWVDRQGQRRITGFSCPQEEKKKRILGSRPPLIEDHMIKEGMRCLRCFHFWEFIAREGIPPEMVVDFLSKDISFFKGPFQFL